MSTHAPNTDLRHVLRTHTPDVKGPGLDTLRDHLLERHRDSVDAILYYGSCLRSGNPFDGLVDLYVLPRSYRGFYGKTVPALFNRLLAPNVYYLELTEEARPIRAKYAVVSTDHFHVGTSHWFHSYLWGRFTQPLAFIYCRDDAVRSAIEDALAEAVVSFLDRVLPLTEPDPTPERLWTTGLALSYGAELRAERPDRARELYRTHADHYIRLTRAAAPDLAWPAHWMGDRLRTRIPSRSRRFSAWGWFLRRILGKVLSVLRLLKGLFTFHGGLDYILWKIERHSGVTVDVSPWARRHPLLGAWGVFWRLYRRGAFR